MFAFSIPPTPQVCGNWLFTDKTLTVSAKDQAVTPVYAHIKTKQCKQVDNSPIHTRTNFMTILQIAVSNVNF